MTAQVPDAIENMHPDVHFGDLKLYALARGEIRSNRGWGEDYELPVDPAPGKPVSTACYQGFRSCFSATSSKLPAPILFAPAPAPAPELNSGQELRAGDQLYRSVYWDPTDPSRCLAPDAFVRLGVPDSIFGSWKTWERGAPEVAVEIVSDSDVSEASWDAKLLRYQELGVRELVR